MPSLLSRVTATDKTAKPLRRPAAGWYQCPMSSLPAPKDSVLSLGGCPSHQKDQHMGFSTLQACCWLPALLQRKTRHLPKAGWLRIPRQNFTVSLSKVFAPKLARASGSLLHSPRIQPTQDTSFLAPCVQVLHVFGPLLLPAKQAH